MPEPEQHDFRNINEWHSLAVRGRQPYMAAHPRTYDVDVTPEGNQLLAEVRGFPAGVGQPT